MAKDPAFLFYPQDFLTGTMFMSNEQIGIYIKLLCAQHQHGGMISKSAFNSLVGEHLILRDKFIEVEDGFFNERLMIEIEKRAKKSTNLSINAKIRWDKEKQKQCKSNAIAYAEQMPIEDVNEDEIENINKDIKMQENKRVVKEYFLDFLPADSSQQFIESWCEWVDYRTEIKKKLTKTSAKKQIEFLLKQRIPKECINQSIQNQWQGLFELKINGGGNGVYSKHITEDKLRGIANDIFNDTDLIR